MSFTLPQVDLPQIKVLDDIQGATDGALNDVAGKLNGLTDAANSVNDVLVQGDAILGALGNWTHSGFSPIDIPDLGIINAKLGELQGKALGELGLRTGMVQDITGSCLNGALGAMGGIATDATVYVKKAMLGLNEIADFPAELVDLSLPLGKARSYINSLGIGDAINDVRNSLGCLGNSAFANSVASQLKGAGDILGLDLGKVATGSTVYSDMKNAIMGGTATLDAVCNAIPGMDINTIATDLDFSNQIDAAISNGVSMLTDIYEDLGTSVVNIATPSAFSDVVKMGGGLLGTGTGIGIDDISVESACASLGITKENILTTNNMYTLLDTKVLEGTGDTMKQIAGGLGIDINTVKTTDDLLAGVSGYVDSAIALGSTMADAVTQGLSDITAFGGDLVVGVSDMFTKDNFIASVMEKVNAGSLIDTFENINFDTGLKMAEAQIADITEKLGLGLEGMPTVASWKGMIASKVEAGFAGAIGITQEYKDQMVEALSAISETADSISRNCIAYAKGELETVATAMASGKTKLPEVNS